MVGGEKGAGQRGYSLSSGVLATSPQPNLTKHQRDPVTPCFLLETKPQIPQAPSPKAPETVSPCCSATLLPYCKYLHLPRYFYKCVPKPLGCHSDTLTWAHT